MMTSLGRLNTILKSVGFSVSPMPNITTPNSGFIHIVSMLPSGVGKTTESTPMASTISPIFFAMKSQMRFVIVVCVFKFVMSVSLNPKRSLDRSTPIGH